jgi:hypothetical protein
VASAGLAVLVPTSPAATREPLSRALSTPSRPAPAYESAARPNQAAALRALRQSSAQRYAAAGAEFQISSSHYDATAVEAVAASLRTLDHGPEMADLSVYVANQEEIAQICGATVIACYVPAAREMVISGEDRPLGGVPRDFAIAHEYGHHIANSSEGEPYAPMVAGTIRWATYERVCQLTRQHRLHPGDQSAHYWENPEEAFAQSYAHLSRPEDAVSWQYTPLLEPSTTSLTKIHADIARPWSGPVTEGWSDSVAAPPAGGSGGKAVSHGRIGVAGGRTVGPLPWVAERRVRTPLDGNVAVTVTATPDDELVAILRDPESGRALARAATAGSAAAELTYSNCGNDQLELEVRSVGGGGGFQAVIERP